MPYTIAGAWLAERKSPLGYWAFLVWAILAVGCTGFLMLHPVVRLVQYIIAMGFTWRRAAALHWAALHSAALAYTACLAIRKPPPDGGRSFLAFLTAVRPGPGRGFDD